MRAPLDATGALQGALVAEMCAASSQCGCAGSSTVFIKYHKTGCVLGQKLVEALGETCGFTHEGSASNSQSEPSSSCSTRTFTIDENNYEHFPRKVLLDLSRQQDGRRYVHLVREPLRLVASYYTYHRLGMERDRWRYAGLWHKISHLSFREGLARVAALAMKHQLPMMLEMHELLRGRNEVLELHLEDIEANFDEKTALMARHVGVAGQCIAPGTDLYQAFADQDTTRWSDTVREMNGHIHASRGPVMSREAFLADSRNDTFRQTQWQKERMERWNRTEAEAFEVLLTEPWASGRLREFGRALGFDYTNASTAFAQVPTKTSQASPMPADDEPVAEAPDWLCAKQEQCGCAGLHSSMYTVLISYHRTANVLAQRLFGEFREVCGLDVLPSLGAGGAERCSYTPLTIDADDAVSVGDALQNLSQPQENARIVHVVREPLRLVASYYSFHLAGSAQDRYRHDALWGAIKNTSLTEGLELVAEQAMRHQLPLMVKTHEMLAGRPDALEFSVEEIEDRYDEQTAELATHAGIHPQCVLPGGPLHRQMASHRAARSGKETKRADVRLTDGSLTDGGSTAATEASAYSALLQLKRTTERLREFGRALGFSYTYT